MSDDEQRAGLGAESQPEVRRGQIWRRRKNQAEVEIEFVKNTGSIRHPYLDIVWYDNRRKRRGSCYEDYWFRNYELVSQGQVGADDQRP